MPKSTFVTNSVVTPAWFNSIQAIAFDDQDLDGHYARLTNDALANTAGNIRYDYYTRIGLFQVTPASGLIVNYNGGSVTMLDGTIVTISPGQISLPANATSYIFVNSSGAIVTSTIYPVQALILASATTNGSAIVGSITDLRPSHTVRPIGRAIKIFGGSGASGNYNLTTGTDTLTGEYYFGNFTVAAGATVNVNGAAKIYCTGNVNIQGTINVLPSIKGGQGYIGSLPAQTYPNSPGSGLGGGNTINAPGSPTYNYFVSNVGSGGAGGWLSITTAIASQISTPRGGNGSGAIIFEVAGTIQVSGAIYAIGENGQGSTSVVPVGGSLTGLVANISGGGGGSGGLILLRSLSSIVVTSAAQISIQGGNGGTGYPNPSSQYTAGGGGGGYFVCESPSINTTGATINIAGGTSSISTGFGSVSGGSFGGVGGAAGQAGGNGQVVYRTVSPI